MQVVFHSTHLTFEEWFKVVLVGTFVFTFAEVEKWSFAASAEAPRIAHPSSRAIVQSRSLRRSLKHEDDHRSNRLLWWSSVRCRARRHRCQRTACASEPIARDEQFGLERSAKIVPDTDRRGSQADRRCQTHAERSSRRHQPEDRSDGEYRRQNRPSTGWNPLGNRVRGSACLGRSWRKLPARSDSRYDGRTLAKYVQATDACG